MFFTDAMFFSGLEYAKIKSMIQILKIIEKNFGLGLVAFAVLSFLSPDIFLLGRNFIDESLMLGLFLGCLKIDFHEIIHLRKNFWKIILFAGISLILLPLVFYVVSFSFEPDFRIALFFLLAISSGVSVPLIASFLRLKTLWCTAFVVLTSMLVPFTLPVLTKLLFGVAVEISIFEMMLFLIKIVFIPLCLAFAVKKLFPKIIKKALVFSGAIGVLNLSLFVAVLIAQSHDLLRESFLQIETMQILIALFVLFFFRFSVGFLLPVRDKQERWTNSLMFGTMNNGLTILISAEFFGPKVLLITLLSEIPWILSQPVFQKLRQRYCGK
jgi:predicted Na+-dependent transporter